jgi:CheY-like chemotaxis protein
MKLLLLTTDLMLISAAQGAADRHGVELSVVPTPSAAVAACGHEAVGLLIIDLRTAGLDIRALMAEHRGTCAALIPVMACGPHVHEAALSAAAAAGCDEVVTRGQCDRRLDATLARIARSAPGPARG